MDPCRLIELNEESLLDNHKILAPVLSKHEIEISIAATYGFLA